MAIDPKEVDEILEKAATDALPEANNLPEAPVSWNMTFLNKDGFRCQITLRDYKMSDLKRKIDFIEEMALVNGWKPAWSWKEEQEKKIEEEKKKCDHKNGFMLVEVKKEGPNKGRYFKKCKKCGKFIGWAKIQ